MTPQDLLAVSPDFLAKTILHRREKMMLDLPSNLAKRQEERHIAAKLAQDSKARKDEISSKTTNLENEKNTALESVIKLLLQINKKCREESEMKFINDNDINLISEKHNFHKTFTKINTILEDNESWCKNNIDSEDTRLELEDFRSQARKLIQSSIKANDAKQELSKENDNINSIWLENESHRRRCESRYTKLKRCRRN